MPYQHPEDRVYTVMSGVFYIGMGCGFTTDNCRRTRQAPSSCSPAVPPHFRWAKSGTYVTQVSAIGPLGLEYLDPIDDPRNK
jgi:hypothetical protein